MQAPFYVSLNSSFENAYGMGCCSVDSYIGITVGRKHRGLAFWYKINLNDVKLLNFDDKRMIGHELLSNEKLMVILNF